MFVIRATYTERRESYTAWCTVPANAHPPRALLPATGRNNPDVSTFPPSRASRCVACPSTTLMGPATCGDSATTVWTYWDKLTLPPFEAACLETWRALNPQHNVEVHENDHHPQRSIADPSRSPPPSTLHCRIDSLPQVLTPQRAAGLVGAQMLPPHFVALPPAKQAHPSFDCMSARALLTLWCLRHRPTLSAFPRSPSAAARGWMPLLSLCNAKGCEQCGTK